MASVVPEISLFADIPYDLLAILPLLEILSLNTLLYRALSADERLTFRHLYRLGYLLLLIAQALRLPYKVVWEVIQRGSHREV